MRAVKDGAEVQEPTFQSGEPGLRSELREFRWMTISGARGFGADANRKHAKWPNPVRRRQQLQQRLLLLFLFLFLRQQKLNRPEP